MKYYNVHNYSNIISYLRSFFILIMIDNLCILIYSIMDAVINRCLSLTQQVFFISRAHGHGHSPFSVYKFSQTFFKTTSAVLENRPHWLHWGQLPKLRMNGSNPSVEHLQHWQKSPDIDLGKPKPYQEKSSTIFLSHTLMLYWMNVLNWFPLFNVHTILIPSWHFSKQRKSQ